MSDASNPFTDVNHPDNPNVLALAAEIWQRSYGTITKLGSRPQDNVQLWQVHVEHARKMLSPKTQAEVLGLSGAPLNDAQLAAKRQGDILLGLVQIQIDDKIIPVQMGANIQAAAKESVAPAAGESKDAELALMQDGIVHPGLFGSKK